MTQIGYNKGNDEEEYIRIRIQREETAGESLREERMEVAFEL